MLRRVWDDGQWPKLGSLASLLFAGECGRIRTGVNIEKSPEKMLTFIYVKILLVGLALAEDSPNQNEPGVHEDLPQRFEDAKSFPSVFLNPGRVKKEADESSGDVALESPPVQAALTGDRQNPLLPVLDLQEGILRSLYSPFENKQSVNDEEDRIQRDKRTFMDGNERETTTTQPFWKRKKENPPFVTGRDGNGQKVRSYQPAQHRSLDNARESHSMKDLDKTVISNEINRNQDALFSSTNRRTYNSRQAESYTPRTPKSVYDTIDYSNRRRPQENRNGFARNFDNKRQSSEKQEQFARQYTYPREYDRPYYPFQGDVIGRGIEYYHRTLDPASGRIIYYANMPDPSRAYDPNFSYDPSGRSIYLNGRTYLYDPYGRSYINPIDYRFSNIYGRSDYLRNGRSSSDYYYQDKNQRNSRFNGIPDRTKDDFRNRTYVIIDAEEPSDRRAQPYPPPSYPRYPPPPYSLPYPPPVPPYPDYYRNQYYPTVQTPLPWSTTKPILGLTTNNYVTRPLNSPEVQIPLSTINRGLYPLGGYDKIRKT